jgi:hypothetical protein
MCYLVHVDNAEEADVYAQGAAGAGESAAELPADQAAWEDTVRATVP